MDGSRQRWDVTPIVPDPDDPSQTPGGEEAQEQDDTEKIDQGSPLDSLEQEVSLDERMRYELFQSLKTQEELSIPEISAQCRE